VEILLQIVGVYLLLGIGAIVALDIVTKRVRNRLKDASYDTQALTGENHVVALIVTVLALWIFWPAAIYAAIRG